MRKLQERFGRRAKRFRLKKGWSQETVAKKTGFSREYVARLEQGLHNPSLSTLAKIAKVFKVRIDTLLG
jgi:transcriptional regulator with XRE-family HTH domain